MGQKVALSGLQHITYYHREYQKIANDLLHGATQTVYSLVRMCSIPTIQPLLSYITRGLFEKKIKG